MAKNRRGLSGQPRPAKTRKRIAAGVARYHARARAAMDLIVRQQLEDQPGGNSAESAELEPQS